MKEILLPKLGESITSAVVVKWLKEEGSEIKLDEPLLEVATDKVNSEIPSPVRGILKQILILPDGECNVGDVIALIEETGEEPAVFISPAVTRLAKEYGINDVEMAALVGSGSTGRLTKQDLEKYIESRKQVNQQQHHTGETEIVKMTGMRKLIAENTVKSFYEAPHASLVTEVDVTKVVLQLKNEKERILADYGVKISITAVVARAIVKALQQYPFLNSSVSGDTIVVKKFVNLGIAVSVNHGIMVPAIKGAQNKKLIDIAREIGDLSAQVRNNTLPPDAVQGGTITLTNFGMSGVLIGVPIIRYPEVAIIGVGAIHKKVMAMENDAFVVRSMMHISLTFDHRVLDGMYGCGFLNEVQKHLEGDSALEDR